MPLAPDEPIEPDDPPPHRARPDQVTLAALLVGRRGEPERSVSQEALRAIRTHLGMEVAFISKFTGGQRVFRVVDTDPGGPALRVGSRDPLEESYCQRVVDGRLPELIRDAREVPAALELPATMAIPVGAHLSVPIRLSDGRVYGTLCCFSTSADYSLNERDLAMMRVFADLTAAQIDHNAAEERRHAETVGRVRAAIDGDRLSAVFQPVVAINSGREVGFEALARFDLAPSQPPDRWFADAAVVGLGVELELAAVRIALRALPQLPAHAYLALNVSPGTAVSGRLNAVLSDTMPHRVVLEITEHEIVETYEGLQAALTGLRRRGLRIAVDDAGAGYASFRHILRLRPEIIKLDLTLTRDIDTDRSRRALASALIAFARETGTAIVAEGVETAGELATLQGLGVDAAQGYHLGHPGPAPEVAQPHRLQLSG